MWPAALFYSIVAHLLAKGEPAFHSGIQKPLLFLYEGTELLQALVVILHTVLRHFRLDLCQLLLQRMNERFGFGVFLTAAGILPALLLAAVILLFLLAFGLWLRGGGPFRAQLRFGPQISPVTTLILVQSPLFYPKMRFGTRSSR